MRRLCMRLTLRMERNCRDKLRDALSDQTMSCVCGSKRMADLLYD